MIEFPVFVKPVARGASININKVQTKEELELLFNSHSDLLIQQFMDGTECGIGVYVELLSKEPASILSKKSL